MKILKGWEGVVHVVRAGPHTINNLYNLLHINAKIGKVSNIQKLYNTQHTVNLQSLYVLQSVQKSLVVVNLDTCFINRITQIQQQPHYM